MALSPEALDALLKAGATAEMIVAVVKADLEAATARADALIADKRARASAVKRRQRAELLHSGQVHKSPEDLAGHIETSEDTAGLVPPKKEGPPDPLRKNTPSSSLRSDSFPARRAWFLEFWSAYPKRDGSNPKQPAEEKFCRLIKASPDPEVLAAEILVGAQKYAASVAGSDAKFIAQATTWLNQGRWKDDHLQADPTHINGARASPIPPGQLFADDIRNPMLRAGAKYFRDQQ